MHKLLKVQLAVQVLITGFHNFLKWHDAQNKATGTKVRKTSRVTHKVLGVTEIGGVTMPYGLCLAKAALKGLHAIIAISTVCPQSNPKSI